VSGNPSPAILAAERAQAHVEECLAAGRSFRLEAGAGAGKTYSLVAALRKIIIEKGTALTHSGRQVACITFTETARREISSEIEEHPAVLVNTIHGFGWGFISRFQKMLRSLVAAQELRQESIAAAGGVDHQDVEYNLGFFGIDEKRITLSHDDIPSFLSAMLANPKFRRIFAGLYPILFIDEYQDTDPLIITALSEHFLKPKAGPIIGLFGDHWQTIYRKDYALQDFPNVCGIDKGSNFRSVLSIVNVLNRLRPELVQAVDDPEAQGEARFFHCNDFAGERVDSPHGKEELPPAELDQVVERMTKTLTGEGWDFDPQKTKILMLTHNVIAAKRGYPNLARIFDRNEAFSKKEDATIAFLADTVESACEAYSRGHFGEMFRFMGGVPTIRRPADKTKWRADMDALLALRKSGTIGDVIDHLKASRRPQLSDRVASREEEIARLGPEPKDEEPNSLKRHRELRAIPYKELISVAEFINGFTPFATQHSVKGAEFDNVLVVLSGGWNHYNWPRLLGYLTTGKISAKDQAGYYRARNLFYVAISRPKKRLAVLATQALNENALASAAKLFGSDAVIALPLAKVVGGGG